MCASKIVITITNVMRKASFWRKALNRTVFQKTGDTPPAAKAADTASLSADEVVKLIDEAEESAAKNLEEFKALVGDHLSKFDERIKSLETKLAESEAKLNSFVETAGAQVPQGNETPDPESQKNDSPVPAAKSSAKK